MIYPKESLKKRPVKKPETNTKQIVPMAIKPKIRSIFDCQFNYIGSALKQGKLSFVKNQSCAFKEFYLFKGNCELTRRSKQAPSNLNSKAFRVKTNVYSKIKSNPFFEYSTADGTSKTSFYHCFISNKKSLTFK